MSIDELYFSVAIEKDNIKQRLSGLIKKYYYKTKASVFGLRQKAIIKKYYKNGKLIKMINHDKIKGIIKEVIYNENGTIGLEKNYRNNKPEGINKLYYLDGGLKVEMSYRDGKLDGSYKMYEENGNLKFIDYYEDGKKIKRKYTIHYPNK